MLSFWPLLIDLISSFVPSLPLPPSLALPSIEAKAEANSKREQDPALMRPGRLDRILYVSPPDLESRTKIFSVNFSKMAVGPEVLIDELAILVRASLVVSRGFVSEGWKRDEELMGFGA